MGSITARQWLTLLTVQFTTILFGIATTSVVVVLPQMRGALAATQDQISWILTLNLVATAVATPLTGWLAARLGWRTLLLCSVMGFTASTVLCGMVESLETLLVLRVLQGAFGAPIFPMGQVILLSNFSKAQHPFILTMWGVGGILGPILGPTFGGLVADLLNWRWTFFMMLPLGIIACVPVLAVLSDRERGTQQRFDYPGYIFIAIAITAAQLMLDRGQRNDWFNSIEISLALFLAVGFFYLFVVHMLTARQPLFEAATFTDRNFALGISVALIMGMLQFTPMVLFPPLLQELRGYPEAVIGYLLATRGIGNFCAFFVVAQFTRYDARLCLFTGLAIQAIAALWMGTLDMNMTTQDVLFTNILHGFGHGLSYTPMAVLSFSTLPAHLLTQGNAIFSLLRLLGSSFFISMTVLVLVHSAAEASVSLSTFVNVFRLDAMPQWIAVYGEPDQGRLYARLAAEIDRQSSMIGYINAFYLLAIVPAVAAPFAFLFVRRKSAGE